MGRNKLSTAKGQREGRDGRNRIRNEKGWKERNAATGCLKFLVSGSHSSAKANHQQQTWALSPTSTFGFCLSFSWQVQNMKYKDKRLKTMNEILSGIKVRKNKKQNNKIKQRKSSGHNDRDCDFVILFSVI